MIKCLAFSFLMTLMAASGLPYATQRLGDNLIAVGLDDDPRAATAPIATPSPDASASGDTSCSSVTFTRSLKYGGDAMNVLDAASAQTTPGAKRPVVVFITGDSFAGSGDSPAVKPLVEQAMCFAASNGLVAFDISYRLAPAATWPAGTKDVSAAISWVHENADLFGGNAQEIIPIGYGTGAFHLASFLAHKEFQERDDHVAGAVLVSGIYRPTANADEGQRAYFGADTGTYDSRSAVPGLVAVEEPIVLAWSSADAPNLIMQGEKLNEQLCKAGHCPRTVVLTGPGSPASVFDLDGTSGNLHERLRQLIGQIDARGLP
ncbi:MAG: alpha/beta hydrolase [Bradyrhizobium sp.]|uniref:alpha/beta hydrolase n=1 Tax=Bradyrhizobium sp. TaxID=376 RepID=UPI001DA62FB4|nr:alpha/beta hydrolase [Bradyrhizobium sp.]MBV9566151.1 alpha/beta hydrolase [Bradyrhizobium sp.]